MFGKFFSTASTKKCSRVVDFDVPLVSISFYYLILIKMLGFQVCISIPYLCWQSLFQMLHHDKCFHLKSCLAKGLTENENGKYDEFRIL
jgi:hypothetical protein